MSEPQQNIFERWPGYDEQSWQQRFNELDRRYSELQQKALAYVFRSLASHGGSGE